MPESRSKLMPAFYGGVIMAVVSEVPGLNLLNCCCCAGIMLGGFLSVMFYTREGPPGSVLLTSGDSLVLGVLAGVFGAFIGTALNALLLGVFGNVAGEVIRSVLGSFGDRIPSDVMEEIEKSFEDAALLTPIAVLISFAKSIILYPLFGMLGGLIGYSVFKPKGQAPSAQPPVIPPTPTGTV